jgi:hypothetical protein
VAGSLGLFLVKKLLWIFKAYLEKFHIEKNVIAKNSTLQDVIYNYLSRNGDFEFFSFTFIFYLNNDSR